MWPIQSAAQPDQLSWFDNFALKVDMPLLTALSFSAADALAIPAALLGFQTTLHQAYNDAVALRNDSSELIAAKNAVFDGLPPGEFNIATANPFSVNVATGSYTGRGGIPYALSIVQRIKAAPAYTPAIGADLDIVPAAPAPLSTIPPTLIVTSLAGSQASIAFVRGDFDGVSIRVVRTPTVGDPTPAVDVGMALVSPFVDTTAPLAVGTPEMRTYQARGYRGNVAVTAWGPEVMVTTIP